MLSGAAGYLLKDSSEEELAIALAVVTRGESYLSPASSTHLVSDYCPAANPAGRPDDGAARVGNDRIGEIDLRRRMVRFPFVGNRLRPQPMATG